MPDTRCPATDSATGSPCTLTVGHAAITRDGHVWQQPDDEPQTTEEERP